MNGAVGRALHERDFSASDQISHGMLCLPQAPGAVFTAFASGHSVEGCPRHAGTGGTGRLIGCLSAEAC